MRALRLILPAVSAACLVAPAWAQPIAAGEAASCVNLGNGLDAPSEGAWGYTIEDAHLAVIADAGFDMVRLPVRWSAHAEQEAPFAIDPAILDRVRHIIDTATDAGLGVVLDMHHYEEAVADPKANRARIGGIWRQIAEAYQDLPPSVAFEIFNEPNGAFTADLMNAVNAEVLTIIRETNPARQVVLGTADWNALESLEALVLPDDPNLAATFHFYEPFAFTHQGAEWAEDPPPVGRRLDPETDAPVFSELKDGIAAAQDRLGVPLFLGEFGAYLPPTDPAERAAYMAVVRGIAEAAGVSWCVWNFSSDFRIYDVETEEFLLGMEEALGIDPPE